MLAEIAQNLSTTSGLPFWVCLVAVKTLVAAAVFLPAISLLAMLSIWAERKVAGHIQARLGPKHVGLVQKD